MSVEGRRSQAHYYGPGVTSVVPGFVAKYLLEIAGDFQVLPLIPDP